MAYCMLIFSGFHILARSLFFFFKFNWVTSSGENHGRKTECGEEFCIINNYNDVFFPTRIKFRQMDLAEELLPIWWLFQITFTLLQSFEFIGKGKAKCGGPESIKSLGPHVFKGPMMLLHLHYPSRGNRRCCTFLFIETATSTTDEKGFIFPAHSLSRSIWVFLNYNALPSAPSQ